MTTTNNGQAATPAEGRGSSAPQADVNDLAALIRSTAEQAHGLHESMVLWAYLQEVVRGEAPPPAMALQVPLPGHERPLAVEKGLACLPLEAIQQMFMPLVTEEGQAIVRGCRELGHLATSLNHVCDLLVRANQAEEAAPAGADEAAAATPATQAGGRRARGVAP